MSRMLALLALLGLAAAGAAQIPGLPGSSQDQLAGDLRGLLLKNLPNPLYEASPNWGHQEASKRLKFRGKFREWHVDVMHEPRNDGVWRKIRAEAINPTDSLVLDLRNVRRTETGKLAFAIFVALDTKFELRQQRWESGFKLFDAQARARARVKITLDCEASSRIEAPNVLPEIVFANKVTKADLQYDNLKFDHIAGIGGEAAQIIGEAAHALVKQWRPSLERDLLDKANAAIVKAGEYKEVRLSLEKLLKSKAK